MGRTNKPRVMAALRRRDGDACFYCGKLMRFPLDAGPLRNARRATIEHLIDQARGGIVSHGNSVLAHDRCNSARSPLKTVAEKIASRSPDAGPIPAAVRHVIENEEAALRQMLEHRRRNGVMPRSLGALG